ncbi:MAG TPA: glycoside hydrolase family 88 protein [Opitutaceae bacterium]|nr:glycoside hydrolase family 88 protein [Opitutaceae bacterium]
MPSHPWRLVALTLLAGLLSTRAATAITDGSELSPDSIRAVLRTVARHQLERFGPVHDGDYTSVASLAAAEAARPATGIAWNYPWGVTLYGVLRSTDATGDNSMLQWALEHNRVVARDYAWFEQVHQKVGNEAWQEFLRHNRKIPIGALLRLGNLDSCGSMGAEFMEGILRRPADAIPEQRAVGEAIADWIEHRQDRLPDGTLWRHASRDQNGDWPAGTIWADDLYMSCPFLVRWSEYTHDPRPLTDAAHQVLQMAARLQDKDGVWFHGYSVPLKEHSPYKWGRANGWAMVAAAEVLSAMPEDHPDRAALLDEFRRHVAGVIKLQAPSGMWRQVLDHPELWEETSCTAMFAYAIARGVNRGWLPASDLTAARKAFAALCAKEITPEGAVNGTCEGTNIGTTLAFYQDRKQPSDDLHGRGVVLLAGTELLNPPVDRSNAAR